MRINIRNMVCNNCVRLLEMELRRLGFEVNDIGLGYADIDKELLTAAEKEALQHSLHKLGFELIEDSEQLLVEAVKLEIIKHINREEPCHMNLSHCIAEATGQDYKHVSRIFSALEGRTIEKFHVLAKIEKAKELLSYGDIPLTEIAYRLGYSTPAFLSRQFKQETGMTPTQYQKSRLPRRPLSAI